MRTCAVLTSVIFAACAVGQIRSSGVAVAPAHPGGGHAPVVSGGHAPGLRTGGVLAPGGSTAGVGNVVYPGTGGAPAPGSILNPGAGFRQPQVGLNQSRGYGRGGGAYRTGNTVIIPYGYPVGAGYGSAYGYDNSYAPPQDLQQQQSAEPPTVIINQTFVPDSLRPAYREYSDGSLPEPSAQMKSLDGPMPHPLEPQPARNAGPVPDPKGTIYLIAYRDGSVYQAVGYWMEGDTLNYVTPRGNINRATMDLIDKDLSEQLNQERNVEFSLRK